MTIHVNLFQTIMGFGSFYARQMLRRVLPSVSLAMNSPFMRVNKDDISPEGSSQGSEDSEDRKLKTVIYLD